MPKRPMSSQISELKQANKILEAKISRQRDEINELKARLTLISEENETLLSHTKWLRVLVQNLVEILKDSKISER